MRVAVHEGQTYIADNGFAGDAINTVCRLCDCAEVKDALSATPGDLVLIVSDRIYYDVIRGCDAHDLPASAFTEVTITMPDKGFQARAFIFSGDPRPAPAASPAAQAAPASRADTPPQSAPAGGPTLNIGEIHHAENVAAEIHHHHGPRDE